MQPELVTFLAIAEFITHPTGPGPCAGDCWTLDPNLYKRHEDGKYFRFASGNGIMIHEADSLLGPWVGTGQALPAGSIIDHPARTSLSAPDVHYEVDTGEYIMYYSLASPASNESIIGVASSPNLEPGSWTDYGAFPNSTTELRSDAIDPNWFIVGKDTYLNFGSPLDGLFQRPLSNLDTVEVDGTGPAQLAANDLHVGAPFLYNQEGEYFMFFTSGLGAEYANQQGAGARIMACRSHSPTGDFADIDGRPCTSSGGTTLINTHANIYAPGGSGVLNDPIYGTIFYYHYADPSIGLTTANYRFGWSPLKWEVGWPVVPYGSTL